MTNTEILDIVMSILLDNKVNVDIVKTVSSELAQKLIESQSK